MERVVGGKRMSGTNMLEGTHGWMDEKSGWMRSEESSADQRVGWREVEGSNPQGKAFWQAAPELAHNRRQQ